MKPALGSTTRHQLEEEFIKVITAFPVREPYTGTRSQRSRLRDFSSFLIGRYVDALALNVPSRKTEKFVTIGAEQKREVTMLKALTWFYVIYNPALATQQFAQRTMIGELFRIFLEAGTSRKEERLNIYPFAFRDDILEAGWDAKLVKRIVADMIGGMGDQEVVKLHQRLTGISLGSVLDYV